MSRSWIGVDVGESEISASLVDEAGELERRWRFSNSRRARREWIESLETLGSVALVLESTESFSERLAREGAAAGFELFTVSAGALENFRRSEGFEDKDDDLDGLLLGRMAQRGSRSVKPALVWTPVERRLRHLIRARSRIVDQVTVIQQRLRAALLRLSPEVGSESWQGPSASSVSFRKVVERWPDLLSLGRARVATVTRLLRRVGRYPEERARELAEVLRSWSRGLSEVNEGDLEGAALEMELCCEQIELLNEHLGRLKRVVRTALAEHPAAPRLLEAPGIGWVTAAWMCAEAAPRARFLTEPQLATYSGLTPASRTSGKYGRSRLRCNVNRNLSSIYYLSAISSLKSSPIDRRYYDKKRRDFQGQPAEHTKATIALARQRHKMQFKLLLGEHYDELKLTRSTLDRATRQESETPRSRPVEAAAADGTVEEPMESHPAHGARVSPSHGSPTAPRKSLRDSHSRSEGRAHASGAARPPTAPTGPTTAHS